MTRMRYGLLAVLLGAALLLAGCGGGDDGVSPADHQAALDAAAAEEKEKAEAAAAAERARLGRIAGARTAIAAAATAADAQAAYDMVKDEATDAESAELMKAVADRTAAIAMAEENQRLEMERQAETARMARIADALDDIEMAETAEDADAAYDAVKDEATDTEDAALMRAVADRKMALATMARAADQMMAISDAATDFEAIDLDDLDTQAKRDAAQAAIDALKMAIADAEDVDDAGAMYQRQLEDADRAVMAAQSAADRMASIDMAMQEIAAAETGAEADAAYEAVKDIASNTEGAALRQAVADRKAELATMDREAAQKMALMTAAGNVSTSDMMTAEEIAAANTAIAALKMAIASAMDVSDDDKAMYQTTVDTAEANVTASQGALDHAYQTKKLADAVTALQMIDLADLDTQAKIDAAETAIADLQAALTAATELSDAEKSAAMVELATANRNVMAAQGREDEESQKMALTAAQAALEMIDLSNLMTQAQIDEADAAIVALDLALAAATDLTAAQKLDATVDVTVAKRRVASAQETLDENIEMQRTALMEAEDDLHAIDIDDLDTQEKIDAAQEALDALKTALDDAIHLSDAEKADAQALFDGDTEKVKMARTGMGLTERMAAQRTALTDATAMARTAVNGVDNDSTDSEVSAADSAIAALEKAIADAVDLPEGSTDVAQGTLDTLKGTLAAAKTARTEYLAEKSKMDDEAMTKAMAKTGKDLHAALAGNATADTTALDNAAVTLSATGLAVDAAVGAGTLADATDPVSVTLTAGDSVAALGSWNGMDYKHTDTGTKIVNEARVYTNKGAGKTVSLADAGITVHTAATAGDDIKGYYTVDETADLAKIMSATFTHSGTQSHTYDTDRQVAFTTRGTFDGAPGQYRCTGTCSSTNDGKGSPSALTGVWHFKPDAGAMVHQPDANYLYYGWWVSKDKDGVPTAASAFDGVVGTIDALTNSNSPSELTGSATYAGHAAGKFAMDNVLAGTGNGGHFTADAMLTAKFGANAAPNNGGISGTINNFRLNDGSVDPGWSVELKRAGWDGTEDTFGGTGNEAMTVWSINGNKAPESGAWSGQVYDEMPGDAPDGDGSTIPTTVTGTFYSEFSTIGRLVGGFGANKQ